MLLPSALAKTSLRALARRPWPSLLMIVGVALGVAVVIAIDLANASASRAFSLSTQAVVGRATHQLVGGPAGLPADLYRQVRVDWGYRQSAPVVEGAALALDLDNQPVRLLGLDPLAEAPFRDYLGGRLSATPGLTALYTQPGAVLIGSRLAARYGLTVTSPLRLQVNDRLITATVAGLLTPADAGQQSALDSLLILDVAAAQEMFARPDRLTRIDLILTDAEAQALAARLPAGARLRPASEQAGAVAQLTSAFQLNLTALSLLALVVGMFLIYNTIMFSVVQRRPVLGILRALGVTGEQVFALVLLEAAAVSAVGAVLGLGLGWLLGQGAVRLVTQTINDLYFVLSVRDAPLTLASALKGLGLGLLAGVLAAAAPALEAAGVEPVTMLRASSLEDRVRAWLPGLALAGAALGVLGALSLWLFTRSLVANFAGLFAIVVGLALLTPGATALAMRLAGPLLDRTLGVLGRLAARTVVKTLSRTSVAIAALMVAVSVTIGVSVMIASFRATVVNWLEVTLVADIYISIPSVGGAQAAPTLAADTPARAAAVPGVAAVDTLRRATVDGPLGSAALLITDAPYRPGQRVYRLANGDPQAVWDRLQTGAVLVSEPFAYRHQLPDAGAQITLRTDRGPHTFPVAGVYYDYSSDQGAVLMSAAIFQQYWEEVGLSGVAVYVAPGADPASVALDLRRALAGSTAQVQVNRALRDQALAVFDRTFAITNALRLLAVVVAFIGVLSALMALQVERARELATLQALGLTPAQLWRLTFLETGLMGLTAGLLSLPTGFILALVLIYVINLRSFGWTIQMQTDPWVYAQALAVSLTAALLAAVYPTRRLLARPIATALRQD